MSRTHSSADVFHDKCNFNRKPSRLEWAQSSWTRWLHLLFWFWINPILNLGYRQTLTKNDLDDLPHSDKSSVSLHKLFIYDWSTTTTWRIILRAFGKETFYGGLIVLPYIGVRLSQPLFLYAIIQQISDKNSTSAHVKNGILFAFGLFICSIVQAILYQQIFFRSTIIGVRVRNALSSIIYRHLLSIKISSLQQITAAHTINLVGNDTKKFEDFWFYGHFLWAGPLEGIITFALLSRIIGILPTCFGFSVLLLLIPIQLIFSRYFSRYRQITIACADNRINAFRELLNGCHTIKIYNWEKPMEDRIRKLREDESTSIRCANHLRALNMALYFSSLCLFSLAMFGGLWYFSYELKINDVFTAFAFLSQIRLTLVTLMTNAIERLSEVLVSSSRINIFMRLDTMHSQKRQLRTISNAVNSNNNLDAIVIHNASFSWEDTDKVCLSLLNVNIKPGQLVGIVGSVGAGKSSLLAAILGEMNLIDGRIQVNGSVSYAAQSTWIFADTIRANILLGKTLIEERYERVLQACCLDIDLRAFGQSGDLTIIGENGVNLSGGQKARVSLARALYADADIYLLDDPLSAVDQKVAKHIIDSCIGPQGLLNGKTCLLVTHQTQFLAASNQSILIANGRIEASGSFEQLPMQREYLNQINDNTTAGEQIDNEQQIIDEELDLSKSIADSKSILQDELASSGRVSSSVWFRLFTAPPSGWFGFGLLIFLLLLGEILYDTTIYWLAYWSSRTYTTQQQVNSYAYIYLILTLSTIVVAIVRADYWFRVMLHGSTDLHNCMLKGILYTSMRFFESNPSGRILNRASRDQQIVDELIPINMFDAIQELLILVGSIVIIAVINPFVLFLFIPIVPIGWFLCRYYLRSSRQFQRLESITRSPVYNLFSSSLNGLATIRAFKVKEDFLQTFIDRIDDNTRAYITMLGGIHWFGLRLDFIGALFAFLTAVLVIIMHDQMDPSLVAFSLICCLNIPNRLQWSMRQLAAVENHMTNAERIDEYAQLLPEEDHGGHQQLVKTPTDWPESWHYRPELEPALRNINLRIEPNEKIGIIGRTGAGKSSLFQGLFRLIERSTIDGEILIDDIDISRVTLDHLRSCLSIIPQIPVLFRGTLRYNLDPFEIYTDDECLTALEAVQLKHRICAHPAGLCLPVIESGSAFSVGERQLICLARAILKQSKILLIDEATANVDEETDRLIQAVIVDKFRDRTILTIAHRLKTIAENDRILVMEQGRVANFDLPKNILQ